MKKYKKLIGTLTKSMVSTIGYEQKDFACFRLTNFKVVKEYVVTKNEQLTFVKQMLPPDVLLSIQNFIGTRVLELEDYQHHKRLILINYTTCGKIDFYFVFDSCSTFKVSTVHSWLNNKGASNSPEFMKMPHGIPYWIKSKSALVSV